MCVYGARKISSCSKLGGLQSSVTMRPCSCDAHQSVGLTSSECVLGQAVGRAAISASVITVFLRIDGRYLGPIGRREDSSWQVLAGPGELRLADVGPFGRAEDPRRTLEMMCHRPVAPNYCSCSYTRLSVESPPTASRSAVACSLHSHHKHIKGAFSLPPSKPWPQ